VSTTDDTPDEGIDAGDLAPDDLESAKAGDDARGGKRDHWLRINVNLDIDIAQILFAVIGVPVVGAVLLAWLAS
jgi:hypothetical protein